MDTEMVLTADLRYLAYSALLALILWLPYMLAAMGKRGPGRVAGYPTGNYTDLPDWAQRGHRAHMNMIENLAPFAALVLAASLAGAANETTALAGIWYGTGIAGRPSFGFLGSGTGSGVVPDELPEREHHCRRRRQRLGP